MEKETLRIWFADMWEPWDLEDFITPILVEKYKLILDQKNPDVLFHSIFNRMQDTPKYKCKKILILAENWRPSQFGSDYSISFDPHTETNFRLPLWQIYWLLDPDLQNRLINRKRHSQFQKFAAFTVSNPSNMTRNSHFDKLHSYSTVMSYGKVRTNSFKLQNASKGRYWRDAKDQFFNEEPHQFMMAYENTNYPYYCTEKLMDSFLVGSMPIYWGDPKVGQDWNEKAFINVQKLGTGWIDEVIKMHKDRILFDEVYSEPVFTDRQYERHVNNIAEFKFWLLNKISE